MVGQYKQADAAAAGAVAAALPNWAMNPVWLGVIILGIAFGVAFRSGQKIGDKAPPAEVWRDLEVSALIAGANFALILALIEILHLSLLAAFITAVMVAASGVNAILEAIRKARKQFLEQQSPGDLRQEMQKKVSRKNVHKDLKALDDQNTDADQNSRP